MADTTKTLNSVTHVRKIERYIELKKTQSATHIYVIERNLKN